MSRPPNQALPLPRLRSELALLQGPPGIAGEPTWLIHDPLQHRYIQIDEATQVVLSLWSQCATADELAARVEQHGQIAVDTDSIAQLIDFVLRNKLADLARNGGWKTLLEESQRTSRAPLTRLAHNYLFFRIPLWRPHDFLTRTLHVARAVTARGPLACIALLGLVGLYLVSRQWDDFVSTFQHVFTWEGALATALALALVKLLHELGHAYAAVHYGCRVPTMGVAFMMMAPMLYTDVTDAWRLRDRHQRLVIAGAGMGVEFAVAAVSVFVWAFVPDGPLRSVAFILATVSIFTSLCINFNPLMRFDGYYLLSDWLGVDNLQDRSFEFAVWDLRERLFSLGMPCPEQLPTRYERALLVYAWSVWIYRLVLFIGIALIVYHYFFKVLGLLLFCLEIGWFLARPLWSEVQVWYRLRAAIRMKRRSAVSATIFATLFLAAVIPWSTHVEIPAVLEPEFLARVFPPRAARILAIHVVPGQNVEIGTPLATLTSPDIDKDIVLSRIKLRLARMQHARRLADAVDREASLELEGTIASLSSRLDGLQRERDELVVRAPLAGRIAELKPDLHAEQWIGAKTMLALIVADGGWIARGYAAETELRRVEVGQRGTFIPESPERPAVVVSVNEIAIASAAQIDIVDLASTYGGRIAVTNDEKRRFVPTAAHYPIRMTADGAHRAAELVQRGIVVVSGHPESLFANVMRRSATVLLRESGF